MKICHKIFSCVITAIMITTTVPVSATTDTATVNKYDVVLKAGVYDDGAYYDSNFEHNPRIFQFTGKDGNLNFSYKDEKNIYIARLDGDKKLTSTLKIPKKYPVTGGVTADKDGNYYILWGRSDTGTAPQYNIFVSKYGNSGEFIKTTAFNGEDFLQRDSSFYANVPFSAGSFSSAINDGVLVFYFSKNMYSGHQMNAIAAVNMSDMSAVDIKKPWVGHSFAQRVIPYKNGFAVADQGDAGPRGFAIDTITAGDRGSGTADKSKVLFHFYIQKKGWEDYDMSVVNKTNAEMGGIGKVSTGIAFVGSSAKSGLDDSSMEESRNLFIQIFDPTSNLNKAGDFVTVGTPRVTNGVDGWTGVKNNKVIQNTDYGVKWLTNYDKTSAVNPKMVVTDDDRIVVMWESFRGYDYVGGYYEILSANGNVLQKFTPLGKTSLSPMQQPIYMDGKVYCVTGAGKKATVNELVIPKK